MKILEIYDGTKNYMFPNMTLATVDIMLKEYPAILSFKHVIETDDSGEVCFGIENLSAMKSRYNIDKSLSDTEALEQLQEIINTPPEESEITPEERIASALEFQTMMMLPDEEV